MGVGNLGPLSHSGECMGIQEKHTFSYIQLCPTLCDPMDCGPPDSSVRTIHRARMVEWVAMHSPGESF